MTRFTLTAVAALMASAAAATAMEVTDLDIDGDGFASAAEIAQVLGDVSASDFNRIDANDDNRWSVRELNSAGTSEILARYEPTMSVVHGISEIDTDGDRFATQAELAAVYDGLNAADFRQIDTNNDNRVNARELYAPMAQAIVTRYEMSPTMDLTIMQVDTDGDFFASKEELMASFPNLSDTDFRRIDANNDNRVNSREYYASEAQVILDRSGS